jgi:pimeloyl-ACP methyl ester carboxylesterase
MQVIVDGIPTTYKKTGQGKVVLLLHGWGDTSETWNNLQKQLSQRFEVVALDLPGFGGTGSPDAIWGLREYAMFVRAFMKKINAREVQAIIGHSNGGAITIYGTGTGIFSPKQIILLASSGVRTRKTLKKEGLSMIAKVGKAAAKPLPQKYQKQLRSKLYKSIGSDALVAPHLLETFRIIVSQDVQAEAAQITIPTLLIYGDRDADTPVALGKILHSNIGGSRMLVLPDVGHFVHHDAPHEVTTAIQEAIK